MHLRYLSARPCASGLCRGSHLSVLNQVQAENTHPRSASSLALHISLKCLLEGDAYFPQPTTPVLDGFIHPNGPKNIENLVCSRGCAARLPRPLRIDEWNYLGWCTDLKRMQDIQELLLHPTGLKSITSLTLSRRHRFPCPVNVISFFSDGFYLISACGGDPHTSQWPEGDHASRLGV